MIEIIDIHGLLSTYPEKIRKPEAFWYFQGVYKNIILILDHFNGLNSSTCSTGFFFAFFMIEVLITQRSTH